MSADFKSTTRVHFFKLNSCAILHLYWLTFPSLFVSMKNHAIRRADLSKRVIETVYPESSSTKKSHTFWAWIKSKVGLQEEVVVDSESSETQVLTFPWHMMQAHDNELYIVNHRYTYLSIICICHLKERQKPVILYLKAIDMVYHIPFFL